MNHQLKRHTSSPLRAGGRRAPARYPQVGPYSLKLAQRPSDSGASRHLADGAARVEWPQDDADDAAAAAAARRPDLSNVGLVVWSSGFVLADLLIRRPPLGPWPGVSVLELVGGLLVISYVLYAICRGPGCVESPNCVLGGLGRLAVGWRRL